MIRFLAVLLAFTAALGAQSEVVAIRGARVVDGTGAPARSATVVVRGARIEAVSADAPVPTGARLIDASGQTLLPGLFDLHTHLSAAAASGAIADWGKNLKAYLDCGVTTVNDFSAYGEMYGPMREMLAKGVVQGPHVNLAARLSTTGGHGTEGGWGDFMTLEANTPLEAHARMRAALAGKPDVIKVFTDGWRYGTAPNLTNMNVETLAAIVQDAHAAGIKVVTHTVTLAGAKIAARAGVDVLVHGIGDAAVDQELVDLMRAKGTAYASTLAVYENHQLSPLPERVVPLLDPAVRAIFGRRGRTAEPGEARQARWQNLLGNVKRLHEGGVSVALGTDAGMTGTFHGYASLRELELLVEAGLKPAEAIMAGTLVSARVMGVDRDKGTIAPGKIADLVLIDGRPDEKIVDIYKTARVFLGGVEVDREGLESAIQKEGLTALPVRHIPAAIDDMERADGRTLLGTLRVNSTDGGVDHSVMRFLPVIRHGRDHALLVTARFAAKEGPYVRLELPLTTGEVELGDVSQYSGVTFEVRGEGTSRLVIYNYGTRLRDPFAAPFNLSGEWQTVRVPFSMLRRQEEIPWTPRDVRALMFELSGEPESSAWMELDNVRFY